MYERAVGRVVRSVLLPSRPVFGCVCVCVCECVECCAAFSADSGGFYCPDNNSLPAPQYAHGTSHNVWHNVMSIFGKYYTKEGVTGKFYKLEIDEIAVDDV